MGERPELLGSWAGAALLAASAASAALFQRIFFRFFRRFFRPGHELWPMRPRIALIYFGGQLALLALLLALSPNMIGVGFALLGQTFGALRSRQWPLPVAALALLLAWPLGLYVRPSTASWLTLLWFVFFLTIQVVIGLLIARLFAQRALLLDLVGQLRRARAAAEAGAAQQEELAVLRERARLAREMHDNVGHALVLVNVKLEAAQRLYHVDAARGDAELEATRSLVRATMGGLRRSLHNLRAPVEPYHDLPAALRRLAAELGAQGGITIEVAAEVAPPPAVAEPLWWIAREALANVERHAGATAARVTLSREADRWLLLIDDNGVGLAAGALSRPGHFGVLGMRERAEHHGGALSIGPSPQGGTTVAASLPVAPAVISTWPRSPS